MNVLFHVTVSLAIVEHSPIVQLSIGWLLDSNATATSA